MRGSDDKPNYSGIDGLVEALKKNDIILSINLNNTGLDSYCSKKLREVLEVNSTIILYFKDYAGWILKTTPKWILTT